MTVERCARHAANAGHKYVGLQFGTQCWSGNDYAQIVSLGESTRCTMTCAGDTTTICGGPWAFNLFEVSRLAAQTAAGGVRTIVAPQHLGCFADKDPGLAFGPNPVMAVDGLNTTDSCIVLAVEKGFRYVGIAAGGECWMGNVTVQHITQYGGSNRCTIPCRGDRRLGCGGKWAFDLYDLNGALADGPSTGQRSVAPGFVRGSTSGPCQ
jgi:glucan endo-1,3-alpha-glucosidase